MLNKTLTKLTARFSLICYLAVASVAVVHAFPVMSFTPASMGVSNAVAIAVASIDVYDKSKSTTSGTAQTADAHCKQMPESSATASSDASFSTCKILCAATSNVIASSFAATPTVATPNTLIAFKPICPASIAAQLEIPPPQLA